MDTDDVKRSNELAENEDLDILWSALYLALEADLSSSGWPKNSRVVLNIVSDKIGWLIWLANNG